MTARGEALKSAMMSSVAATPVAVVVTVVAHEPDPIALVPIADVPLAIVIVQVVQPIVPVVVIVPPVIGEVVAMLVTVPVPIKPV